MNWFTAVPHCISVASLESFQSVDKLWLFCY